MTLDETLAQVAADVEGGELVMARRRLRELLVSRPHRLDARAALAQIYREIGDPAQAGRWGYLADDPPPHELDAFRAACDGDASLMLDALAWGEDDDGDSEEFLMDEAQVTPIARERVADLRRGAVAAMAAERAAVVDRVLAGPGDAPAAAGSAGRHDPAPGAEGPLAGSFTVPQAPGELPVGRQRSPLDRGHADRAPGQPTHGRRSGPPREAASTAQSTPQAPDAEAGGRQPARMREKLGVALIIVGILVVLLSLVVVVIALGVGIAWVVRQIHA